MHGPPTHVVLSPINVPPTATQFSSVTSEHASATQHAPVGMHGSPTQVVSSPKYVPPASSHRDSVSITHTSSTQHPPVSEHGSSAHKVPSPLKTPLNSIHFSSGTSTHTSVTQHEPTVQGELEQSIPLPKNVPSVASQADRDVTRHDSSVQQAPAVLAHGSPSHVVPFPL